MTQTTASKPGRAPRGQRVDQEQGTCIVRTPSRLDQLEALLLRKQGASIAEMVEATGWQAHSVRGAMAGALKKKRGLLITSEKTSGLRHYQASRPA